jgi:transcriptional regulator with XRE-family HTH domain
MTTEECRKWFLETTGRVISKKRKQKNISQKKLGKVLNVAATTIGRYEKGAIEIPVSSLPLISSACQFHLRDYLIEWEEIDIEELVRKAVSLKMSTSIERLVKLIMKNCTEDEMDKMKDIALCIKHTHDKSYQEELLIFMIDYHIENKQDDAVKKRMLAYYKALSHLADTPDKKE